MTKRELVSPTGIEHVTFYLQGGSDSDEEPGRYAFYVVLATKTLSLKVFQIVSCINVFILKLLRESIIG